jgi:hypothetical protein
MVASNGLEEGLHGHACGEDDQVVSDTYEEEAGGDAANAEEVQERHDEVESLVDESGTSVDGKVVCDVLVAVVEYWVCSVADDGL